MRSDPEFGDTRSILDSKASRIWILRRWRSMPRLFQVYLIAALLMFLVIFGLVSLTGSSTRTTSPPQREEYDGLPLPEIPNKNPVQNDNSGHSEDDKKLFSFDSSNGDHEISWQRDLLSQTLNDDQQKVVEAMKHSWDAYKKHAWGEDHLLPITKGKQNWFNIGLTIIDSLDTLLLMGSDMKYAFDDAMDWIENTLSFDIYKDVNCFEMTIRVLGGLLSSFHLTKNPTLLAKAVDVGDRLIHCFDSPSKVIPYSDVNLRTKTPKSPAWSQDSSLSEVSSVQLEFRDLSRLIHDEKFETTSFATSEHIHSLVQKRGDPLLPMYINPNSGDLSPSTVTLGARGDSYYEYLLKQFLQTGVGWLRDDYLDAVDAIKERMFQRTLGPKKLAYVAEILRGSGDLNPKMDHLVCFLPGTLALGHYHYLVGKSLHDKHEYRGHAIDENDKPQTEAPLIPFESPASHRFSDHLSIAEDLARTCFEMYNMTATGLSPEIVYFGTKVGEEEMYIKPADTHNLLRPEYVESLFYLYHMTGKEVYRQQGRQILDSFNRYSRVPSGGYTTIDDVRNPNRLRPRNMQESFWTAETLKYLFLLFSDDKRLIDKMLTRFVFNTEAHLIPLKV